MVAPAAMFFLYDVSLDSTDDAKLLTKAADQIALLIGRLQADQADLVDHPAGLRVADDVLAAALQVRQLLKPVEPYEPNPNPR